MDKCVELISRPEHSTKQKLSIKKKIIKSVQIETTRITIELKTEKSDSIQTQSVYLKI